MYTILVTEDNELVTSVREKIMQKSKLVDTLHFLVDPIYKETVYMSEFSVAMEYITPVSREYKIELLSKSDELYNGKLEYKLPLDTNLTKEAGNVEIQLTFTKVSSDDDGVTTQHVRKTSPAKITIVPIASWSDVIADSALTALDQRLIQIDAAIEAANAMNDSLVTSINEMNEYLMANKADNIVYNEDEKYIQLVANGNPIGNKISMNNAVNVSSVKISEEGHLIVNYSDGKEEDLGEVAGEKCVGVYIPSFKEDGGILTFTLSKTAGEDTYEFDIRDSDNWNDVSDEAEESTYEWNQL